MTARDRWERELKCPVCGKTGTARISEADGWEFQNDQSTRVDFTPDGFSYEIVDGINRFSCTDRFYSDDSAGNAGGQTTALIIRGLSLGTIKVKDYYKVLVKETMTAIIVGLILAIVNYGWLLLQQNLGIINVDDSRIFVLVSLTLMISIVVAKSIGSSLPILAKVLKLDPALMSGSFVTTVADVLALIVYFYLAGIILN